MMLCWCWEDIVHMSCSPSQPSSSFPGGRADITMMSLMDLSPHLLHWRGQSGEEEPCIGVKNLGWEEMGWDGWGGGWVG